LKRGKKKDHLADGGGLYLQLSAGKQGHIRRSWIFRYDRDGKRTDVGLGGLTVRTLKEAREEAKRLRLVLHDGDDPLEQKRMAVETKRRERLERTAELAKRKTFGECVTLFLAKHQTDWTNEKHRTQWKSTLEQYANPYVGKLFVNDIDTPHIVELLTPIWDTKRETARRVLGRVERVLNYAKASNYRMGDNPARWTGHLKELMASNRVAPEHHAALAYEDIPAFMVELRERGSLSARALEFTILTAARTGEIIGAPWDEIDLDAKTWTIPAARMKNGKEHGVPLSKRAVEILHGLERTGDKPFPLSPMSMRRLLQTVRPGCTIHGFRSTFRDWVADTTAYPNHVAEQALAHAIPDKVEAAYRRGALFAKRTRLMQTWADYCAKPVQASAKVTPILKGARS
jgi:integrase